MRIAIVCPYDLHSPGGVQTHILDLSKELTRLGHYVRIIAPGNNNNKLADNGHVIYLGNSRKINFNKTRFDITLARGTERQKLSKMLDDEKFDVIHYHTIWTPVLPLQILLASNSANVATFHDTPPDNFSGKLTKILFRFISYFLLKKLDAAIAVSEAPAEHLTRATGCVFRIIPPCTNLQYFSPGVPPLIRKVDATVTILFLGRIEQRKGIVHLLAAFNSLAREQLDVRLLIAGDGDAADLIRTYVEPDILPRIKILGRIYESDKAACYTSCDIFCSPALYGESFGIVLVEAMASGLPVLAAANKGYSAVLKDKSDLCLARPGDTEDLFRKLRNLVINSKLREELGQWGINEAKKYQCSNLVYQYVNIYQEALELKR